MTALSFALSYAGFTALCLAMERHHEQAFGSRRVPAPRRRLLRTAGAALLAGALLALVRAEGWGLGVVVWCGVLTAAALPVALMLRYAPRAVPVAPAAVLVGCGALVLI